MYSKGGWGRRRKTKDRLSVVLNLDMLRVIDVILVVTRGGYPITDVLSRVASSVLKISYTILNLYNVDQNDEHAHVSVYYGNTNRKRGRDAEMGRTFAGTEKDGENVGPMCYAIV